MKKGKAISHGNTDLRTKLTSGSCFATNDGTNMSLNQVDYAVRNAACLGIQQDLLLAVQLADHKKLLPPMRLQARKPCPRSDQGTDSITITLQVVELASYCGFYSSTAWLLLFGDIEENSTCPATIILGLVFAKV